MLVRGRLYAVVAEAFGARQSMWPGWFLEQALQSTRHPAWPIPGYQHLGVSIVVAELPADPRQLLSEAEHQELNADLARMADMRRRAEVESRHEPMA